MKSLYLLVILICTLDATSLKPVDVSPKAFSGLWYEIARTYNDFEKNCVAATVQYDLSGENSFEVTNRCFEKKIGGDLIIYEGSAKTLRKNSAAKLTLTYFWIFTQEYHIVHWDEAYAVMASPDFQHVWIMSRTPQMPKAALELILQKLSSVMKIEKFIYTPQDKQGRYQ